MVAESIHRLRYLGNGRRPGPPACALANLPQSPILPRRDRQLRQPLQRDFGHRRDGGDHFNLVLPRSAGEFDLSVVDTVRELICERVVRAYGGSFIVRMHQLLTIIIQRRSDLIFEHNHIVHRVRGMLVNQPDSRPARDVPHAGCGWSQHGVCCAD